MKNDIHVPSKSKKLKTLKHFFDVLKVTDENSWIRIHKSDVWIRGSGSVPKFHGSATLRNMYEINGFLSLDDYTKFRITSPFSLFQQ